MHTEGEAGGGNDESPDDDHGRISPALAVAVRPHPKPTKCRLGNGSQQKDPKNEDRSGDMHENKGQYDKMSVTMTDICA